MVKLIFVDCEYEEIERQCLEISMEDAIKSLPNLNFRVGTDRLFYDKTGVIIVDLLEKSIEIQLDFPIE